MFTAVFYCYETKFIIHVRPTDLSETTLINIKEKIKHLLQDCFPLGHKLFWQLSRRQY